MAGKRQPTDVVIANGRKHLSKTEEAERRAGEVKVSPAKTAKPPKWLPETLKKDFRAIGKRLIAAGLYTELDADTLGRYLVAQHQWLIATGEAEKALAQRDQENADGWGKIQERYFKQARNCANDMGLTVTSRCRLVVPDTGKHSTLNIYVDGELKFTKSESLDGGQRTFNLQVSYGARVEIEVELGEVSQRQTVKADKAKTVRMNFNDKTDTTVPDGTD